MDNPKRLSNRLSEQRFGRIVMGLMTLGFLAVLVAGIMAAWAMVQSENRTDWVNHTVRVERTVRAMRLSLEEMRSTRRGALLHLDADMPARYRAAADRLFRQIDVIAALTVDNPRQQARIHDLRASGHRLDARMRASFATSTVLLPARETLLRAESAHVVAISGAMLAEEQRLLALREADRRFTIRLFYITLAAAAALLLLVAIGSTWIIRRYTRDLTYSRDQLRLLNDDLEGAVGERTRDLQRANDEIQRFAYIVSHDLRSPLVNVMGFTAELDAATKPIRQLIEKADADAPGLVSADARLAATEDLPEAIGFIRTSTQKMDRLINAILRLSREGRRTVAPERLDMTAMARGVVDNLRHRIDELGITIRIDAPLPTIVSDRFAVEQILSNLVENAVKYLQPGRPGIIAIRGRRQGSRAIFDVEDNGRGIEPRDHERVFDLFRRSGQQDQPGEGIGLAHVRALAYRIGGTIAVTSELGAGAIFHVNLPVEFTEDKRATA